MTLHESFRTHTLNVSTPVRASDGASGWTRGYTAAGTVTGSLQPSSSSEQQLGGTERAKVRWTFYCDLDEPLARDQKLTNPDTGQEYLIVAVLRWADGSELAHLRVDLEEIQKGT